VAEIYIEQASYHKAARVLELAKSRTDYDFEKHVGMRIKKLQAKIKRLSETAEQLD
jgi:hypothetical protein